MQYPYLPVGAFIGAALVIIPAPWHWKARNIPTLSLMGWLYVLNIIYGVNSILWAGNVNNPSPVWCDITTKLMIGGQIALPAATFCITRSLESISAGRVVYRDSASKRRWMIFEIFVCIGFPILVMGLHYVVQGHRFDIIENFGCEPAVYFSIASVFILSFPPLFFAVLTLGFGGAAFHHFLRHRINFIEHLAHSDCALTTQRYLRLMIMALFLIVWNTSLTAYNLAVNTAPGLRKWTNWDDVHSNFSRVDLYAEFLLPPSFIRNLMLFWWAVPVSSYIVFFFFGLGEEAMKEYRKLCMWFRRCVLKKEDITFSGSLPSYKYVLTSRPYHCA
ncbi:fungal pheromone STE3G-protein-coupled receptor [Artomyces pyxidatus]|uniref:Fungal pheromone STE3G-protein-coupled receptor n=1 Tax=Artomyces pyxidatus TaxID=48021 RepID=A0ACB8SK14_9AGAM|nr:fungal pheromone STE3G-protein-coupled receptor [Artomyces pyxidatus]